MTEDQKLFIPEKTASIYPLAIPEIAVEAGLDFLLLDLPANYSILRVGVGYVHECLKRTGIRHQTLDLNMILYHRFHMHRILDRPDSITAPSGYVMPQDPWGAVQVDEWLNPELTAYFQADIEALADQIVSQRPRIVGLSLQMGNRLLSGELVRLLRARAPETVIVVGGFDCVHREFGPKIFPDFDYMVIGEAELVLPGLVAALLSGERPADLPGAVSRFDSPDRSWVPAPLVQDLDQLPFPSYDWADLSLYRYHFGLMIAPLAINRGCKWSRCTFCNECFTWRKRSPEHVVDEIQWFCEQGCRSFDFSVSDAIGDSTTLLEIAREIIRRGLKIAINTQLRIDKRSDLAFFQTLYAAGFQHMAFGVDGWSDPLLRMQNKGYNFALVRQNLRDAHQAGIRVSVNVVLGIPGETNDDVIECVNNIVSVKEYIHTFNSIYPLMLAPGSKYYDDPERFGICFRGEREEIYDRNPYRIPPELWYSTDPYIDQAVRISRIVFLHKHLLANGIQVAGHVTYMLNKIIGEFNAYNKAQAEREAQEAQAAALAEAASANHSAQQPECLISILCQGRHRAGADRFLWRLSTVLNKHAENLLFLGLEGEAEILVADWGSEVPLHAALELTENARKLVRFVEVPPELAAQCDGSLGYSTPHAVNTVARRARGRHLLFADADLFVPIETMAKLVHYLRLGYFHSFSLGDSFFWASSRLVPKEFCAASPYREHLEQHIQEHGAGYPQRQVTPEGEGYAGAGVALLMRRELWLEATGFDERCAGAADVDLTARLLTRYRWDDLENHGMRFFLLEHDPEQGTPAPFASASAAPAPAGISANGEGWGLAGHHFPCRDGFGLENGETDEHQLRPYRAGHRPLFDTEGPLRSVRELTASDARYRDLAGRFPFEPHSFYCNADAVQALLSVLQPETVCEIGSWMGASARSFAAHPSVRQVACVDHWDRYRIEKYRPGVHPEHMMNNMYEQFLANTVHSQTDAKICPVRLDSEAAIAYCSARGLSFDLIYVDGDHTTVGARSDILRWYPLLNAGGYMCGDDWTWQKEPDNVSGAVISVAREKDLRVYFHGNFWLLTAGGFSVQPLTMEVLREIKPVVRPTATAPAPLPLVSIVCTCKNAEGTLRRHLDAIVAAVERYDNIEYVVQDGVSSDATLAIFEEYRPRLGERLKLVSAKDSCCEEGFWLAMARCQGEIICASLTDEEILPDAIPYVVRQFLDHPEIDVIHGDIYNTDLEGNIECRNPSRAFDLASYLAHQLPMHLAASFFRKSAFEKAGLLPYPNRYGLLKDDFFTWAYLGLTANIGYCPEVFAKYAVHGNAISVRPDLLAAGISRRNDFLESFISDPAAPRALQESRSQIMARFFAVSAHRLGKAELTEEAGKYQAALAQLAA